MALTLTEYGVTKQEVERFKRHESVKAWMGRFSESSGKWKVHVLCRYFKWLRIVKGVNFSPYELLNEQIQLRGSDNIEDRRKHLRWVLEYARDNPDFADFSDGRKYGMFTTIKTFYDFHETPLTTAKNVYGKRNKNRRKNKRRQITLAQAKQIISVLPQRERTILLIVLQSGMEIGAVLEKTNFMWHKIMPQIEAGKMRVKVNLDERKGNGFPYFTYFSYDAIQELKKWLLIRERIVLEHGEPEGKPIFLTEKGTVYDEVNYFWVMRHHKRKKSIPDFVTHQFRKLFKTEASIPERGVDRDVVEFWMGHISAIGSKGGIYDRTPEIHEDVIEREYMKLEPFLNIYSSTVAMREADPLMERINSLCNLPGAREMYESITATAEDKLRDILRKQTH